MNVFFVKCSLVGEDEFDEPCVAYHIEKSS